MAARDCGMNRPSVQSGESKASNGASSTRPSGRPGAGCDGTPRRAASSPAVVLSVFARRTASAGSLSAAISARASSGPSVAEPQGGDPVRVGVAQRGLRGRPLGQRGDPAGGHRRRAAQDGVDELGAARRLVLDELDGVADDGVGGHAVQERELVEPEAQRGADGRVEPLDGPLGQLLRERVQRGLALDGAVGEPGGQRAVAAVQPAAPRLAVERAIGPRVLLEDAPDDCKRACTGGGGVRSA